MPTVLPDPLPPELEALLERRKRAGGDRFDEVWEGVLHMAPAPSNAHGDLQHQLHEILGPLARQAGLKMTGEVNIGVGKDDYRVPDAVVHRPGAGGVWHPTAALAAEIVSAGDETWEKLSFYAAHDVDEVLIVNEAKREVTWLTLAEGEYQTVEQSGLIELGPAALTGRIDWP